MLNQRAPIKRTPLTSSTTIFSWCRRSTRRRINIATKVKLLRSKSWKRRHLSGRPPSFWPVRCFRRPVRYRLKEDDHTHTPNVMSWRSGELDSRCSSIRAWGAAWRREHRWCCSSARSRLSTTTRTSSDGHACWLIELLRLRRAIGQNGGCGPSNWSVRRDSAGRPHDWLYLLINTIPFSCNIHNLCM